MNNLTIDNQVLVDRLTSRMDLDRIFLFSYPSLHGEQQQLLLVVNPVRGLSPKALAPIVSLCFSDTEEAIPFDMILAGEWQNQLKQGCLYYTYASLPQHELYTSSKKKNHLHYRKTITGLLELAELNYEKCKKASDEFRDGAENFVVRGDYGQATFMLHQFLELRLKGFQVALGVNTGKSHNIKHQLKSTMAMAPQLLSIFPFDSPAGELFKLLDQSYIHARRQETLTVTEEEFNVLVAKCELAKNTMDDMVSAMLERIREYREQLRADTPVLPETPAKAKQVPVAVSGATQLICEDFSDFPWPQAYKQDVNKLLDKLRQSHNPEQIMMLNYHTGGFSGSSLFKPEERIDGEAGAKVELYLVVLMNNKGPFHFKRLQLGVASAMVVYLNTKTVQKNLEEGNRFYHTLWTKGRVLRRKSTFEPSFDLADIDWQSEHERAEKTWRNAKACMGNLNELFQNAPELKL